MPSKASILRLILYSPFVLFFSFLVFQLEEFRFLYNFWLLKFRQVCPVLGPVFLTQFADGGVAVVRGLHPRPFGGHLPVAGLRLVHHQPAHLHRLQPDVQARLHPAPEMPVPQVAHHQSGGLGQRHHRRHRPASLQPLRLRLRGTRQQQQQPAAAAAAAAGRPVGG